MITFESHKNKRGWIQLEIYKDGELLGLIYRKRCNVWRSGYSYGIVGHNNIREQPTLKRAKEMAILIFGAENDPIQS